jgi:hypothetical protein
MTDDLTYDHWPAFTTGGLPKGVSFLRDIYYLSFLRLPFRGASSTGGVHMCIVYDVLHAASMTFSTLSHHYVDSRDNRLL